MIVLTLYIVIFFNFFFSLQNTVDKWLDLIEIRFGRFDGELDDKILTNNQNPMEILHAKATDAR